MQEWRVVHAGVANIILHAGMAHAGVANIILHAVYRLIIITSVDEPCAFWPTESLYFPVKNT